MTEIFVSTDIETDGPCPGMNSMLSLASAAFLDGKNGMFDTFSVNLQVLPEATPDPDTMRWWATQPKAAWDAHRTSLWSATDAMRSYFGWLNTLARLNLAEGDKANKIIFVGYPVSFDYTYVHWYLMTFGEGEPGKRNPFFHQTIDMRSYAMGLRGGSYTDSSKKFMPAEWMPADRPHTHIALDDAIEQGELFCNMMAARAKMNT